MLKQFSLMLVLSPLLVACGGGGGVDKIVIPPKSSSSSSVASSSSTPASTSSSSSSSTSSSGPVVVDISVTDGWRANNGAGAPTFSADGVTFTPTVTGHGTVFTVAKPTTLEGATIEFIVNVSNEFKVSGAALQVVAQIVDGDTYPGEWDCTTGNTELTEGADQTISCIIDQGGIFDQTAFDAQVGIQAVSDAVIAGTVIIKSAKITYPAGVTSSSSSSSPSALTVDFENDTVGDNVYGVIGYTETPTATVVTAASVGLPANGSSIKVAKVATTDWDTIPKFLVTLPEGKTLADYQVKVDAYFPYTTLGLDATTGADNYYKSFLLFAGAEITGAAKPADFPTFHHTTIETDYDSVDKWKTFTFDVDATKGALLTGTVEIGLGISRPAVGTNNNAYYLDNITLVPKP